MSVFNNVLKPVAGICCVLVLLSCGSSDDGGGTPPPAQGTTVSGTATAPNGSLAKLQMPQKAWYARLFSLGEAWAQTIIGFTPVQNATVLVFRIDPKTGVPVGPNLVSGITTNAAGAYQVTLPVGVTPSSDLILQITTVVGAVPQPVGTANTMSTPLVQTALNVDPVSEGVMREVLAYVGANPFTLVNFSNNELVDLIAMIRAVLTANPSLVGATIGQTIANIQASVAPQINQAIPQMASGTRYLIIFSTALPNGQVGVPYSQPILAIGAPGPLTYQVTVGTLPAGLVLNAATGQITGPPTTQGPSNFTIQVSVATPPPSPVTQALTITIDPPPPPPVGLERVSLNSAGVEGNGHSPASTGFDRAPSISRDGRFVAFSSNASNLVANDTNAVADIFVRDRGTGTTPPSTTRISVGPAGAQGAQDSLRPAISGNGRYVVFASRANLDPLDVSATNVYDIYRHDRNTGETHLINTFGVGQQFGGYTPAPNVATNNNGNLVVWSDGSFEIFVFDLLVPNSGGVVIAPGSITSAQVLNPVISDDGRYVAFVTNRPVDPTDTNSSFDVYLADRQANTFTLVTAGGSQAVVVDTVISMSSDGRYVAYTTEAAMVPGDTNGVRDVYVFDRLNPGTRQRVSVNSSGGQGTLASRDPAISANGEFVAFTSAATNLVPNDTNAVDDVFLHNRTTGQTRRLSQTSGGSQGDNDSHLPSVNGDGSATAFVSLSSNLVLPTTNGFIDVFVAP